MLEWIPGKRQSGLPAGGGAKGDQGRPGARMSADAEQTLGFLNAVRIAHKLEGQPAVSFLQNNSQTSEVVTVEAVSNILFHLPDLFQLKKARPKIGLNVHHDGANNKQAECEKPEKPEKLKSRNVEAGGQRRQTAPLLVTPNKS